MPCSLSDKTDHCLYSAKDFGLLLCKGVVLPKRRRGKRSSREAGKGCVPDRLRRCLQH